MIIRAGDFICARISERARLCMYAILFSRGSVSSALLNCSVHVCVGVYVSVCVITCVSVSKRDGLSTQPDKLPMLFNYLR